MHLAPGSSSASSPKIRTRVTWLLIAVALASHALSASCSSRSPAQRKPRDGGSSAAKLAEKTGTRVSSSTRVGAPPAVQWTKTFAGSGTAHGACAQQTIDGGYIAVGGTSFSDSSPASAALLVKVNAQGVTTWVKTIKGSSGVEASSVQQTADGGYVVAGSGTLTPGWQENAWLIKTDDTGHVIRQSAVSETTDAVGYSVVGNDGSYYLTAVFPGDDSGLVLFKTDSLGNPQWGARYPIHYNMPYGEAHVPLGRTSDGGFIIGTKTLLKVDSLGNPHWLRTYNGITYALSVQQTPDGGYVATGPTQNDAGIYLLKTTANGDPMWVKEYASSEASSGEWIERTGDGGYVVAGSIDPGGESWITAVLLRISPNGTLSWTDSLCVGDASCVRQTSDGGYIVTGTRLHVPDGAQSLFLTKFAPEGKSKVK